MAPKWRFRGKIGLNLNSIFQAVVLRVILPDFVAIC